MDKITPIGLLLAAVAVVGGSILKGAGAGALLSGAAFMIVFALSVACNYGYAAGWKNQWLNMISFLRHFVMAMPTVLWRP